MSYADQPKTEDQAVEDPVQPSVDRQTEMTDVTDRARSVIGACRSRRGAAIIKHTTND